MQRDEPVWIDVLAGRRDRAEALGGRLDHDTRRGGGPPPAPPPPPAATIAPAQRAPST
jgi:hypothetical protein